MTALPALRQERRTKTAPSKVLDNEEVEELPAKLPEEAHSPTSPSLMLPGTRRKTRRVSFTEEPEEFQVRTPSGDNCGTLSSSTQSTEASLGGLEAETPVRTPSIFLDGAAPWFPTTPTTPMQPAPGSRFPGCNLDDDEDDDRQSVDADTAAPAAPALLCALKAQAEPTYHQMLLAIQKAALEDLAAQQKELESLMLNPDEEVQKAALAQLQEVCKPFFEHMCQSLHGALKAHVQRQSQSGSPTSAEPTAPMPAVSGAPRSLIPPSYAKAQEATLGSSDAEGADQSGAAAAKTLMVCRHWKCKGFCKLGDQCKFLHPEHKRGVGPSRKRGAGQRGVDKATPATIAVNGTSGHIEMQLHDGRGQAAVYHHAGGCAQATMANLEQLWHTYNMQYPCPQPVSMQRVCLAD